MAFGSSTAYGPACGQCFQLTLQNPVIANPPFHPAPKSITVKITDLCPFTQGGWCGATTDEPNAGDAYLNFDLAYPSDAIPDDFFPSDESLYGYKDFGVWNITYAVVPCIPSWPGARNAAALGSVANLGTGVCCPANPTGSPNDTCPSFSDQNGIPPDTTTTSNACHSFSARHSFLLILLYSLALFRS
ncbi:hypothetical protein AGABI1DRAFT_126718 [Agaricus bisporus var. burnettii JB137-S8]|uniref:Expansin-like EG45 domain-containing protein n=2 Tax=Agaricus bisporus var. burnettii TaxID=192524 RepID=K5XC53_AGABU|nr:uncharacterized protein AGABI1DRAFT_126718 [Agaricus bisporus var. burnettii JB137-S8]EKM80667.1 hypothetical protein AGABI1DRAFT_126718 [Agaricus bisporus var. burnettii JB137-S8]KAF7782297.1 hypothetical protein Agabi119p4_1673 [Agaricus bisporus var. burnettii]